jgi:metal-responsive CopG/Arc/MetJ family transcriptional regulator
VRLPDSLWTGLAKRAKQDAISRNRVIRDAVAAWLNNNNEDMK